jgi:hypothetical protein
LPVLLTAAINGLIETVGVRASTDDGLTCGADHLIGGDNDFMSGENDLMNGETAGVNGEKDLVNGENGHADDQNSRAADDRPLHFDLVIVVEDLNAGRWGEMDGATKPNVKLTHRNHSRAARR